MQTVTESWRVNTTSGSGTSSVTLDVPSGYEFQPLSILATLVANSTGDARQVELGIVTSGGTEVACLARPGVTQAASTTYKYEFAQGVADLTAVRDSNYVTTPLPVMFVPASHSLKVHDNNLIQTNGDSLTVQMIYASRRV